MSEVDIFQNSIISRDQTFNGKKVFWSKSWPDGTSIDYDGIPFFIVGHEIFECHNGAQHKKKVDQNKPQESSCQIKDHVYGTKRRRHLQDTKKMGCLAAIKVIVVIKLPQYRVDGLVSEWAKRQITQRIKADVAIGLVEKEARFYINFPEVEHHKHHLTGEFAGYCQPLANKIRKKITELAMLGIRKVSDVKVFLDNYVSKEMFPGIAVSRNNRRYFPSTKDISNHIYNTLQKSRFSLGDQQNLQCMVNAWKTERPTDYFYVRTAEQVECEQEQESDEISHPSGFLFAHQTSWQKRLLMLYGKELCLLDATYNTSKYDLPLFFLCVQTNVGYSICGTFIASNESKNCIAEALTIFKNWNPEWMPSNFLTDFDEREIAAIEEVFPGCSTYLCTFHREQAWDRWLKELKNGLTNNKDEVLKMLRKIANSSTQDDYDNHLDELKTSNVYQSNPKLKSWLERKWFPEYQRWVFAFRKHLVNVRLNTTNGLERKHRDLKENYLKHYGDGSLTTLVSTLIDKFLRESYDDYMSYNVKSLDICKRYHVSIPDFLKNRPKMFIEHCIARLPPNISIHPDDITEDVNITGNYRVKSADSDLNYYVSLDHNGPSCQCIDWGKHHLPCKHMLAVFTHVENWDWETLPPAYRDCPHFNLDPVVIDMSSFALSSESSMFTSNDEDVISLDTNDMQPVLSTDTTEGVTYGKLITSCSHILKDIQNNIYKLNNEQSLKRMIHHLNVVFEESQKLPLRTNRRRKLKVNLTRTRKRQSEENSCIIIDRTCDIPVEINEVLKDACTESSAHTASSNEYQLNEEPVEVKSGGKRKKTKETDSDGNRVKKIRKTVAFKDPVAQVQEYDNIVNLNRGNLVLDVVGYKITQQSFDDLDTLLPDEVVNAYISLKCRNCKGKRVRFIPCEIMSSIFSDVINLEDPFPVHGFLSEVNIDEYDILIGGLNENGVHWTLMFIFPETRQLLYLNSLGEPIRKRQKYLQCWILFLAERYNRGIGNSLVDNWSVQIKRHGKQYDSNSCGVFILKFAELILNDEEDLFFDSSARGIRAMRHVIGQCITECSNFKITPANIFELNPSHVKTLKIQSNMEEIPTTQELAEHEVEKNTDKTLDSDDELDKTLDSDDELDGDPRTFLLTVQICNRNYECMKESMYPIMECQEVTCHLDCHKRHHEFMKNPLKVYNRERVTHGFGGDVGNSKTIHHLHVMLAKDLVYTSSDPKRPYSGPKSRQIKNVKNGKLKQIFTVYPQLADCYIYGVILKEFIVKIHMQLSGSNYGESNELCRCTEINTSTEVKRIKNKRC